MIRLVILLFVIILSAPVRAQAILLIEAGDARLFRVQRLEASLVMTDNFGGLAGDAISLPKGTYRIQVVSDEMVPRIRYGDVRIDDRNMVTPAPDRSPFYSSAYRDRQAWVRRVDPAVRFQGKVAVVSFPADTSASQNVRVRAPMRATNWATDLSGLGRLSVTISSIPANAEIWIAGEPTGLRTDRSFVIPMRTDRPMAEFDVTIRKPGFANVTLSIGTSDNQVRFNAVLPPL